ncbi:hypothetical protein [Aurantiacibacter zhengii]|uniref:Phage shock protein B n=1 Tax=Aurantiacibacter zhengii TaxID=2307003 RepID=A0A418NUF4_9SPHN|nr:hypothetical protein [Aurantiacibacter zhengii]RIV87782.1 hypothetical protein D2V07_05490 [Aurantiacibacter zhengii]
MEWILVPLAPFLMVLGIVWIQSRSKLEEKRLAATAEQTSEKAAQYASKVQQLEDRVKVLERIVTDRGYDIATQIEALRDQRSVDEGNGIPLEISKREKA